MSDGIARQPRSIGRLASIRDTRVDGPTRYLRLEGGDQLVVHRFAVAGKGDEMWADSRGLTVALRKGWARVTPLYRRSIALDIAGRPRRIQIREISTAAELVGYRHLADFHYRGEAGFGRKAVLVAVANSPDLPLVLGFVEITTGFLMSKPRTRVLNAPYDDGDVSWSEWRATAMKELTSLVARASRVVVYPELRGLGLGSTLLRQAQTFAATRFHARGVRPLFLEITADMMKFVPFAARSGMHYVGETEGNLHRVAKDLRYLLGDPKKLRSTDLTSSARGIMSAQRRYATTFQDSAESIEGLEAALSTRGSGVPSDTYAKYYGVLRLPKPTYLVGLTPRSERFVARRVAKLEIGTPAAYVPERLDPVDGAIELCGVSIAFRSKVDRTTRSTAIQEAFGIRPDLLVSRVIDDLTLRLEAGSITLLFGPSGSGKTTLLDYLASGELADGCEVQGKVLFPSNARIGSFGGLPQDRPLIEVLAQDRSVEAAIYALNVAGLSEAHLYLKHFGQLSNGQKYRAILASLIDSSSNVWVADEFLSTLDPVSASVVAANIAKHARRRGVTLIVGAPHFDHFIDALRPDVVVRLSSAWEHEVLSGEAFMRQWRGKDGK